MADLVAIRAVNGLVDEIYLESAPSIKHAASGISHVDTKMVFRGLPA